MQRALLHDVEQYAQRRHPVGLRHVRVQGVVQLRALLLRAGALHELDALGAGVPRADCAAGVFCGNHHGPRRVVLPRSVALHARHLARALLRHRSLHRAAADDAAAVGVHVQHMPSLARGGGDAAREHVRAGARALHGLRTGLRGLHLPAALCGYGAVRRLQHGCARARRRAVRARERVKGQQNINF